MKRLLKIGLLLLFLVVLALASIPFWIDGEAKDAINREATAALGVRAEIETVALKVFGGRARLGGLTVANVDGYAAPHFMQMRESRVEVSLGSLLDDTVVVPEVVIEGVDVRLERKGGRANYQDILRNIARSPTESGGKKFVIRRVIIRDISVEGRVSLTGLIRPPVRATIPELRFENVGSESDGGALLSEVVGTVVRALLAGVVESGIGLPKEIVQGLGGGLGDVGGLGLEVVDVAGNVIKDGARGIVEGIGGIFEKD